MLLSFTVAKAQNNKQNWNKNANAFVSSVFLKNRDAKYIMENYMYFEPNEKYTMDYRSKILAERIEQLKKEKLVLFNFKDYSLVPYNDYKGEKVYFSKEGENIIILISNGKPLIYFYYKNDKIFSFEYISKANEGYFITY